MAPNPFVGGLLLVCPTATICLWNIIELQKGDVMAIFKQGIVFPEVTNLNVWGAIFAFGLFQVLLMKFVPGKAIEGPLTIQGHTPQYKDNGLYCYIITLLVYFAGIHFEVWNGGVMIEYCGPVIVRLNIFALTLCFFLMYKGYNRPSTNDTKYSGDFFSDYFWGTELYPRLCFDLDVKVWTNCRMGMTMWPLIILSCWFYQLEQFDGHVTNNLKVNVILQMIYITKFFWWEGGYYKTIDIMVDCAGFYLCWGCLVWVPTVYTINSTYLAFHPEFETSNLLLGSYFLIGIICIYINYDIDNQRGWIRAANGLCNVWGKPAEFITAEYFTSNGDAKSSILIHSGWWGIARHIHYVFEMLAAWMWSFPCTFESPVGYLYIFQLTCILMHRIFRDEHKCKLKYGKSYQEYCELVPYRLIPGIF